MMFICGLWIDQVVIGKITPVAVVCQARMFVAFSKQTQKQSRKSTVTKRRAPVQQIVQLSHCGFTQPLGGKDPLSAAPQDGVAPCDTKTCPYEQQFIAGGAAKQVVTNTQIRPSFGCQFIRTSTAKSVGR